MSSAQMVVIAIVLITVAACSLIAWSWLRSRSLQQRFGPEYDRVVEESDTRPAAERELRERQKRHAAWELKTLSPQVRAGYVTAWQELQGQFIDAPHVAVNRADDLVTQLLVELGYPVSDYEEQLAQLSVDHASTLQAYREAHQIALSNRREEASTEQLRVAVVHFRTLVAQLLGEEPAPQLAYEVQPLPTARRR